MRPLSLQGTPREHVAAVAFAALVLSGCFGDRGESKGWTVGEAEAISHVRGLPVRVVACRGLGAGERDGNVVRYARLSCSAGARARGDRFDTVAVLFEVHVQDDAGHELQAVRFVGGPGIP